jgi:hypothetical protein
MRSVATPYHQLTQVTRSSFVMQTPGNAQNFNYVRGWLWKSLTITQFRHPVLKSRWSLLKHQAPP